MDCFDFVFHLLESRGVGAYCVCWHAATAGGKQTERHYDAVITGGGVIVKSCEVVFQSSAEVRCQFREHDGVHCCAARDRAMLTIFKKGMLIRTPDQA